MNTLKNLGGAVAVPWTTKQPREAWLSTTTEWRMLLEGRSLL
jgi:hypothetical protein